MPYYFTDSILNEISAVFRVEGADANTYLQGQFTQDLNRPIGSVAYGLFLNQKGKVVADAHVLKLGENCFLVVSYSLSAPKLRERLEAYLIADEVTIADETESWARISLWGDGASAGIAKLFGVSVPSDTHTWVEVGNRLVFRGRRIAGINFELLVPREECSGVSAELKGIGVQEADMNQAERERILGGIPLVPVDIGLSDLPNEGGLDSVAISYTKGCYLGQEVMARLKNLGQVRRRLHIVRGKGSVPASGTLLFQNGHKVGELRSAASDSDGFVAMAMLSSVNLVASDGLCLASDVATAVITIIRRV